MAIETAGSFYLDTVRLTPVSPVSGRTGAEKIEELERIGKTGKKFDKMLDDTQIADQEERQVSKKPHIDKTDKLYEQCEALETFLVKNLLNSMRSTVEKSGFIDEGFAGKMYEDMLYDEYAKGYTKNADFGLADLAYLELTGQRGK